LRFTTNSKKETVTSTQSHPEGRNAGSVNGRDPYMFHLKSTIY
jgi:hypothetical protein